MSDLRKEREGAARRYVVGGVLFIAVLVLLPICFPILRECGLDRFGWSEHRVCSLPETWTWILSGADWVFWTTLFTVVICCAWSSRDDE